MNVASSRFRYHNTVNTGLVNANRAKPLDNIPVDNTQNNNISVSGFNPVLCTAMNVSVFSRALPVKSTQVPNKSKVLYFEYCDNERPQSQVSAKVNQYESASGNEGGHSSWSKPSKVETNRPSTLNFQQSSQEGYNSDWNANPQIEDMRDLVEEEEESLLNAEIARQQYREKVQRHYKKLASPEMEYLSQSWSCSLNTPDTPSPSYRLGIDESDWREIDHRRTRSLERGQSLFASSETLLTSNGHLSGHLAHMDKVDLSSVDSSPMSNFSRQSSTESSGFNTTNTPREGEPDNIENCSRKKKKVRVRRHDSIIRSDSAPDLSSKYVDSNLDSINRPDKGTILNERVNEETKDSVSSESSNGMSTAKPPKLSPRHSSLRVMQEVLHESSNEGKEMTHSLMKLHTVNSTDTASNSSSAVVVILPRKSKCKSLDDPHSESSLCSSRLDPHSYQSYAAGILNSARRSEPFLRLQKHYATLERIKDIEDQTELVNARYGKERFNTLDVRSQSLGALAPQSRDDSLLLSKYRLDNLWELKELYAELDEAQEDHEFFYDNKNLENIQWKPWADAGLLTKHLTIEDLQRLYKMGENLNYYSKHRKQMTEKEKGFKRQLSFSKLRERYHNLDEQTQKMRIWDEIFNSPFCRRGSSASSTVSTPTGSYIEKQENSKKVAKHFRPSFGYNINDRGNKYEMHVQKMKHLSKSMPELPKLNIHVRSESVPLKIQNQPSSQTQQLTRSDSFKQSHFNSHTIMKTVKNSEENEDSVIIVDDEMSTVHGKGLTVKTDSQYVGSISYVVKDHGTGVKSTVAGMENEEDLESSEELESSKPKLNIISPSTKSTESGYSTSDSKHQIDNQIQMSRHDKVRNDCRGKPQTWYSEVRSIIGTNVDKTDTRQPESKDELAKPVNYRSEIQVQTKESPMSFFSDPDSQAKARRFFASQAIDKKQSLKEEAKTIIGNAPTPVITPDSTREEVLQGLDLVRSEPMTSKFSGGRGWRKDSKPQPGAVMSALKQIQALQGEMENSVDKLSRISHSLQKEFPSEKSVLKGYMKRTSQDSRVKSRKFHLGADVLTPNHSQIERLDDNQTDEVKVIHGKKAVDVLQSDHNPDNDGTHSFQTRLLRSKSSGDVPQGNEGVVDRVKSQLEHSFSQKSTKFPKSGLTSTSSRSALGRYEAKIRSKSSTHPSNTASSTDSTMHNAPNKSHELSPIQRPKSLNLERENHGKLLPGKERPTQNEINNTKGILKPQFSRSSPSFSVHRTSNIQEVGGQSTLYGETVFVEKPDQKENSHPLEYHNGDKDLLALGKAGDPSKVSALQTHHEVVRKQVRRLLHEDSPVTFKSPLNSENSYMSDDQGMGAGYFQHGQTDDAKVNLQKSGSLTPDVSSSTEDRVAMSDPSYGALRKWSGVNVEAGLDDQKNLDQVQPSRKWSHLRDLGSREEESDIQSSAETLIIKDSDSEDGDTEETPERQNKSNVRLMRSIFESRSKGMSKSEPNVKGLDKADVEEVNILMPRTVSGDLKDIRELYGDGSGFKNKKWEEQLITSQNETQPKQSRNDKYFRHIVTSKKPQVRDQDLLQNLDTIDSEWKRDKEKLQKQRSYNSEQDCKIQDAEPTVAVHNNFNSTQYTPLQNNNEQQEVKNRPFSNNTQKEPEMKQQISSVQNAVGPPEYKNPPQYENPIHSPEYQLQHQWAIGKESNQNLLQESNLQSNQNGNQLNYPSSRTANLQNNHRYNSERNETANKDMESKNAHYFQQLNHSQRSTSALDNYEVLHMTGQKIQRESATVQSSVADESSHRSAFHRVQPTDHVTVQHGSVRSEIKSSKPEPMVHVAHSQHVRPLVHAITEVKQFYSVKELLHDNHVKTEVHMEDGFHDYGWKKLETNKGDMGPKEHQTINTQRDTVKHLNDNNVESTNKARNNYADIVVPKNRQKSKTKDPTDILNSEKTVNLTSGQIQQSGAGQSDGTVGYSGQDNSGYKPNLSNTGQLTYNSQIPEKPQRAFKYNDHPQDIHSAGDKSRNDSNGMIRQGNHSEKSENNGNKIRHYRSEKQQPSTVKDHRKTEYEQMQRLQLQRYIQLQQQVHDKEYNNNDDNAYTIQRDGGGSQYVHQQGSTEDPIYHNIPPYYSKAQYHQARDSGPETQSYPKDKEQYYTPKQLSKDGHTNNTAATSRDTRQNHNDQVKRRGVDIFSEQSGSRNQSHNGSWQHYSSTEVAESQKQFKQTNVHSKQDTNYDTIPARPEMPKHYIPSGGQQETVNTVAPPRPTEPDYYPSNYAYGQYHEELARYGHQQDVQGNIVTYGQDLERLTRSSYHTGDHGSVLVYGQHGQVEQDERKNGTDVRKQNTQSTNNVMKSGRVQIGAYSPAREAAGAYILP